MDDDEQRRLDNRRRSNVTAVGRFAAGLNALGILFFFAWPYLLRFKTRREFERFEMGSAVDEVVRNELQSTASIRILVLVLSTIGMCAAIGILKRKQWAPSVWTGLCVVWIGLRLCNAFQNGDWSSASWFAIFFSCIVALGTVSTLFSREARNDFAAAQEQK